MTKTIWIIQEGEVYALTAGVKARLLRDYAFAPDPTHTHVALVNVIEDHAVRLAFPYSLKVADWQGRTGQLEAAIDSAVRAALQVQRDTEALASIVDRWHPL